MHDRHDRREALVAVEDVLVSTPRYPFARALAAASAFWAGDVARAGEHAGELWGLLPGFSLDGFIATFGARFGPVERVAAALEQIAALSVARPQR